MRINLFGFTGTRHELTGGYKYFLSKQRTVSGIDVFEITVPNVECERRGKERCDTIGTGKKGQPIEGFHFFPALACVAFQALLAELPSRA